MRRKGETIAGYTLSMLHYTSIIVWFSAINMVLLHTFAKQLQIIQSKRIAQEAVDTFSLIATIDIVIANSYLKQNKAVLFGDASIYSVY